MHISKITPETMADIWCGMPENTRNDRCEDLGSAYLMKAIHPILGAVVISGDADHVPGCDHLRVGWAQKEASRFVIFVVFVEDADRPFRKQDVAGDKPSSEQRMLTNFSCLYPHINAALRQLVYVDGSLHQHRSRAEGRCL